MTLRLTETYPSYKGKGRGVCGVLYLPPRVNTHIYIYIFNPQTILSYAPHICYHHCMKYHHTYPLDICMLKYRYASASNVNPI